MSAAGAVDASGAIVGDDIGTQTEQALRNVMAALDAAGATPDDVVKPSIYLVQGQDVREGAPPRSGSGEPGPRRSPS